MDSTNEATDTIIELIDLIYFEYSMITQYYRNNNANINDNKCGFYTFIVNVRWRLGLGSFCTSAFTMKKFDA